MQYGEVNAPLARELTRVQSCMAFDRELLPGNEVGVMIERSYNDFVARAHIRTTHAEATRLSDSVVPRVKIRQDGSETPTKRAIRSRDSRYRSVARTDSAYAPRCGLALSCS